MARRKQVDPDEGYGWCQVCGENTIHSIARQACRICEIRAQIADAEWRRTVASLWKIIPVVLLAALVAVGYCASDDKKSAPSHSAAYYDPPSRYVPPIDYAKRARDGVAERANAAVGSDMGIAITDTDGPDALEVLADQGTCNRAMLTKVRARLKQRAILDDALGAGFISLACSVDPAQLALDEKVKLPANQPGAEVGPAKTGPHCVKGCPCGNSCISCAKTCNVGPGTAWK